MKCKKLKGVIDEKSSMDLIDNQMKANLRKKLTRNKTISTGGLNNMLAPSNRKTTASFKQDKRPPMSKMTDVHIQKYDMKDHSPAFVI